MISEKAGVPPHIRPFDRNGSPLPARPLSPVAGRRPPTVGRAQSPLLSQEGRPRFKNWLTTCLQIKDTLGKGTFGAVYLAKVDHSFVAVQHFPEFVVVKLANRAEYTKYALREMDLMRKIQHPHVVKLIDSWREPLTPPTNQYAGMYCIAMEYCNGGDLAQLIREQRRRQKAFNNSIIESFALQICSGIAACHSLHIHHRDIKPQNVFANIKNDRVYLLLGDFGISRAQERTLEPAFSQVGTPLYLAPEIAQNRPYTTKADIWAFGVILYELLTFEKPFPMMQNDNTRHFAHLYKRICTEDPSEGLKRVRSTYDPVFIELTLRCLSKNPEERPSAYEILTSFHPKITEAVKRLNIMVAEKRTASPVPETSPSLGMQTSRTQARAPAQKSTSERPNSPVRVATGRSSPLRRAEGISQPSQPVVPAVSAGQQFAVGNEPRQRNASPVRDSVRQRSSSPAGVQARSPCADDEIRNETSERPNIVCQHNTPNTLLYGENISENFKKYSGHVTPPQPYPSGVLHVRDTPVEDRTPVVPPAATRERTDEERLAKIARELRHASKQSISSDPLFSAVGSNLELYALVKVMLTSRKMGCHNTPPQKESLRTLISIYTRNPDMVLHNISLVTQSETPLKSMNV